MDTEANHVNVQVSAPETWEALPFNNTLHGGKPLLLTLNLFPTFDISLIVIIINVTQLKPHLMLSRQVLLFRLYSMGKLR